MRSAMGMQTTSLVRHVFRLLKAALKDNRGIPWVLLENARPHRTQDLHLQIFRSLELCDCVKSHISLNWRYLVPWSIGEMKELDVSVLRTPPA